MTQLRKIYWFAVVALALVVTPELALAQGKPQQEKPATNAATSAKARVQEQEKEPSEQPAEARGGPHEGIKVHGHWVIEVHNPDGTVVTHREFENSLRAGGGDVVTATLLSRGASAGAWEVLLFGGPGATSLCVQNGTASACYIGEASFLPAAGVQSANLSVSANGGRLVLSGSVNVPSAGIINLVQTALGTCLPGAAPSTCPTLGPVGGGNSSSYTFTSAALSAPISIAAGQIVQVTVTISFS